MELKSNQSAFQNKEWERMRPLSDFPGWIIEKERISDLKRWAIIGGISRLHGDVTVHSSAQIQLLNKNICSDTKLNANTTRKDEGVVGCKVMLQCKIWLKGDRCSDVFDDDLGKGRPQLKKRFSFGHCPNKGGEGVYPCPDFLAPFFLPSISP